MKIAGLRMCTHKHICVCMHVTIVPTATVRSWILNETTVAKFLLYVRPGRLVKYSNLAPWYIFDIDEIPCTDY